MDYPRYLVDIHTHCFPDAVAPRAMANLIAGRRVVKELIQKDFTPEAVAREAQALLDDPAARAALRTEDGP